MKTYWGDLHGHSRWSREAVGDPESYYPYARDVSHLDFSALTDHDFSITPRRWMRIVDLAQRHNRPHEFITFIAYEWTATRYGHKVVLFGDDNVPEQIFKHSQKEADNPNKLWRCLDPYEAVTIPHHPLASSISTDWSYRNDEMQPFVELYSKHGSSEFRGAEPKLRAPARNNASSVQAALARGHRLGFIGGTDTHRARPGSPAKTELFTHRLILCHHGGLAAVRAPELTRAALFESFRRRRVYATTGARTQVDFSSGDHHMGEEFTTSDVPQFACTIEARPPAWSAAGIDPSPTIALVELLKNNEVIRAFEPGEASFSFCFTDRHVEIGMSYYYVRIVQSDGHRAWASPLWVHYQP